MSSSKVGYLNSKLMLRWDSPFRRVEKQNLQCHECIINLLRGRSEALKITSIQAASFFTQYICTCLIECLITVSLILHAV